jgi:hypothetical protein
MAFSQTYAVYGQLFLSGTQVAQYFSEIAYQIV